MTDMNTIRDKKDAELVTFVNEQRDLIQKARFGMGGSDVKASRTAKKNIARALTELTARAHKANN